MSYPMFHPLSLLDRTFEFTGEQFAAEFPVEGQHVEFKEGLSERAVRETAMAFSNAEGGVILLGVADNGTVRGANLKPESEVQLRNALQQVSNLGQHQLQPLVVDGRAVLAIGVAARRDSFAQLPSGQVKQRRGASNHTLMGAELADFIARRFVRSVEATATARQSSVIVDDLALKVARAWGWETTSDGATPELQVRLSDNGFIEPRGGSGGDSLTVAGVLFLVNDPGAALGGKAYVEVFRYRDEGVDYDRREEFRGPLQDQVERATDFILGELGFEMAQLGVRRHELHRLPRPVLREAVANAVAHRSYMALGEAVRIDLRPDRVVVRSPGGLPDGVTLDNIAQRSVARNTLVIRTLRFLGVAEEAGRGVDLMCKHMALNLMHPPEFEADPTSVTVVLRLGSAATPAERAWLVQTLAAEKEVIARPYSVGDYAADIDAVRPQDVALLVRAARGEVLSNATARDLLGADAQEARGSLRRLRDRGLLRQAGAGAGTTYTLSPATTSPNEVRHAPREHEAQVLDMALQGPVTNADIRARTGLGRAAVVQIFNRLLASGQLERCGSKRGTHYVLSTTEANRSASESRSTDTEE
ncbi:MAG: putative DNA binding domain-containing protein [Chloroflexi bacterium]|nr:putative DNA binding domain-containing protein [Chloroflexota bacterium]